MKKTGAFALVAMLTGSLITPALAVEMKPLISPAPDHYEMVLSVNGAKLDTETLPASVGIPLRLIAEADHGSASWFQEENTGAFYLDGNQVNVNFTDYSVELNGKTLDGVTAEVKDGITFLSVEAFSGLKGYTVTTSSEQGENRIEIITPNSAPMVQLAYEIVETSGAGYGMKADAETLKNYGIDSANFTEVVAFFPMITSPDTVLVAKLADGKEAKAKADLEAYRQQQEDTFSWYLSQNLPKVKDARTVVKDGYLLFVIAEHADQAVKTFGAGVQNLGK